jgi:4-alpha-glucanotransferase
MSPNQKQKPKRISGVFLHPTSLPGLDGIGSLGIHARRFIDWLKLAGQGLWQVMPLGPTGYGNSPYATLSAFAGNPLLIDLAALQEAKLLDEKDLKTLKISENFNSVDFEKVLEEKPRLLKKAWDVFKIQSSPDQRASFHEFCDKHDSWLNDFARFTALKSIHEDRPWYEWDQGYRSPSRQILERLEADHGDLVGQAKFIQWLFFMQWQSLRRYARDNGVEIMGDVPIFVAHDSADVWAHQELFQLNADGSAAFVAGVPPDYFSETGQLWGNPLYRWDTMRKNGYRWWLQRLALMREMFDRVRIDHFRGFEAYWEIPGGAETAIDGRWVKGPNKDFFRAVQRNFSALPLVAEDLGLITPEVEELRDEFSLPGMRVLQFAFTDDWSHPFLPHNYLPNSVVYLGTHDNDTTVGWLNSLGIGDEEAEKNPEREKLQQFLQLSGAETATEINEQLIRLALFSVSHTSILMMQDILGLGTDARINTPGRPDGNWEWRLAAEKLTSELADKVREVTEISGRIPKNKGTETTG